MKRYRKLLIVLGGLVGLVVVAVLALVLLVDVDAYRGVIETKAEEALGRDIRLGELSLSILPFGRPGVRSLRRTGNPWPY